ncbi:MAG TPA: polysaccharide biosynthesis/export family protein [Steroidobacteraceae bacterium]|nr:polysaccharide biosynthesis/export family protein [Steroidobacteraceae bacterium]
MHRLSTTRHGRLSSIWQPVLLWLLSSTIAMAAAAIGNLPSDYRLGPGDLLHITVAGYAEMTTDVRVSQTGNITYPFIGEVSVANLSTQDVEGIIARKLNDGAFIRQPQVSVLVAEYEGQKISVMGQVAKPGQYPLTASARVMDVLAEAGGTVPAIAADEATLLRKDGSKAAIDLQSLFEGDPRQNLTVSGGDTVYVPKAPQFYIYGEVQKPGMYRLERNMTVSRAISAGGGLTSKGSEGRVVVKRRDANGKEHSSSVDSSADVKADDVIFVKQGWF